MMDPDNTVVRLCTEGMRAEADGRSGDARDLFSQAWDAAVDDYEACIAAHYLARHQPTTVETLRWNQECLARADRVGDDRVRAFYPSLHGTIARAQQELGRPDEARKHFLLAARYAAELPDGPYGSWLRYRIAEGLRSTDSAGSVAEPDPVRELLTTFCARRDFDALALVLPPYLGNLGTPADEELLSNALHMLHAQRSLSDGEQDTLGRLVSLRMAGCDRPHLAIRDQSRPGE